jgi:transcription antitermination factor NusG
MLGNSVEDLLSTKVAGVETFAPADVDVEAYVHAQWYAAYTRANHERRVFNQLVEYGVESFLPQYESVRKWKDRRVRLQMPLFPGYVFVHLALQNRLRVLQVPGVAYLVGFAGRPVAVPEEEFAKIRGFLSQGLRAEPHPYLTAGRRVRVRSGPLEGMEGIIIRRKNCSRFVISFTLLQRSIGVEVAGLELEPAACSSNRNESASVHG